MSRTPPLHHSNTPILQFSLSPMIELRDDSLHFSFPDLHPDAHCTISFQRTLRIPDEVRERASKRRQLSAPGIACAPTPDMGLAPGGQMRQETYHDRSGFNLCYRRPTSRSFIH